MSASRKLFVNLAVADSTRQTEAILAVTAENRAGVDELADRALEVGATQANDPMELEFMYGRSFYDPDGHHWEVFWLDPADLEQPAA